MNVVDILTQINKRPGISYRLVGRYDGGENQGAFRLTDAQGVAFVLKYQQRAGWLARLEHARRITGRLSERGVRVPRYVLIGALDDDWSYGVQSALPGAPPASLTPDQARRLINWLELQTGQGLATEPNWATYVRAAVFAGESGWSESFRVYSPATRGLLQRMQRCVDGLDDVCSQAADIVHGDLALDNVLVDAGQVSSIVDWDAAGRGDRVLDFAKLLYYSYDNRPVRDLLRRHILELRGAASLRVHLVYCILAQLDWSIHHHGPAAVDSFVAQAHTMLDDLKRI